MTPEASADTCALSPDSPAALLREQANIMYANFYSRIENGKHVCPYLQSCLGTRTIGSHSFDSDFTLRIGSRYGACPTVPKVLFIGKESVEYHGRSGATSSSDTNPHYLRTLRTMAYLSEKARDEKTNFNPYTQTDVSLLNDYSAYFALTNFYKCAFKDSGKHSDVKNTAAQTKNCAALLLKEIECIRPQIIIKQTLAGSRRFEQMLQGVTVKYCNEEFCGIRLYEACETRISSYKYHALPNTPFARLFPAAFYIVYTPHPCARGKYSFDRTWKYTKQAIDFVLEDIRQSSKIL